MDNVCVFSIVDGVGHSVVCWNEVDKGWILSGYFYGYIVLQVFGGTLAQKIGTKSVLGISTLFTSLLALFIPISSKSDVRLVFTITLLQGLASGVTYPCLPPMIMR